MRPLLAVPLLMACSGADLVDTLTPRSGYSLTADLAFGADPRLRLDLYRPDRPLPDAPPVVFFYGGNWDSGNKGMYRFVAQALASRGYAVAIPDYRLYPQARYPDFLRDCAAAVAWVRRDGAAHGLRPGPVAVMGHSAGAYNAVMLAADPRWLAEQGLDPARDLAAAVGLAGPYDFLPLRSDMLKDLFGPEDRRPDTQPILHLGEAAPPLFLATGTADETVLPRNSRNLAAKARRLGVPVREMEYEGLGHVGILASFAVPLRWFSPVLEDVDSFLRSPPRRPEG
ncbi:acetyl esterase/lipase [Azospirillum picis]|uniref:Acetyl esterase/lipase n=1 Tax=Azospirillum picis TaxID=488438 RepID=A0ABU0MPA9_9PROT|nr:acetyl esterase/lipase [Azospirillum picis]MDQ0535174.1 acetyl esterase/lipase [Azospirillum picis]